MDQIYKERLLNVAKALRESPKPEAFTMEIYAYDQINMAAGSRFNRKDVSCGTPACALGHYAARQDLQDLLFLNRFGYMRISDKYNSRDDSSAAAYYDRPEVVRHFGLDYTEAEELFGADGCGKAKTVEEAALYIEEFVKERE